MCIRDSRGSLQERFRLDSQLFPDYARGAGREDDGMIEPGAIQRLQDSGRDRRSARACHADDVGTQLRWRSTPRLYSAHEFA